MHQTSLGSVSRVLHQPLSQLRSFSRNICNACTRLAMRMSGTGRRFHVHSADIHIFPQQMRSVQSSSSRCQGPGEGGRSESERVHLVGAHSASFQLRGSERNRDWRHGAK